MVAVPQVEAARFASRFRNRRFAGLYLLLLLAGLLVFPGCVGTAAQLMYVLFGHKSKPEFDEFKGKRVAVVTISNETAFGPETVSELLSRAISMHFVKNIKKVDVISQSQIASWMDQNGFGEPDPMALGKGVNADYVMLVNISDYSIYDGKTLYKGSCNYKTDVYNIKENGRLVFSQGPLDFTFPRDGRPAIESSEEKFQAFYLTRLSERIARSFYEYDLTEDAALDAQLMP
ncbi:MAG: hypothetical protein JNK57_08135 [Planctomycetaceae bacterium]|jgi:hypothetical protein|nr:hypothetical protein [Planctomycetaceae bacterium]